jgi:hypothetical protein
VAVSYLGLSRLRVRPPQEGAVTFQNSPPERVTTPDGDSIALSPSGDRLMFVGVGSDGGRESWLRPLNALRQTRISGTELVNSVFWSPDGRSIAFFAAGKLKSLDLQNGSQQVICEVPIARSSGSWSRNGTILFETLDRPEIYQFRCYRAPKGTEAREFNCDASDERRAKFFLGAPGRNEHEIRSERSYRSRSPVARWLSYSKAVIIVRR